MPRGAPGLGRALRTALGVGSLLSILFSTELAASQTQARLSVSAYVLVSSTITATVNATRTAVGAPSGDTASATSSTPRADSATNNRNAAPTSAPKREPLCASVTVSCTGKAPMRVSVDGSGEAIDSTQQCGVAQSAPPLSLCAPADSDTKSLGITVEY